MFLDFHRYFLRYIFKGRSKQRLLLLAVVGLFISAFALLVLQSTMGGLQHKLVTRSKQINGQGILELRQEMRSDYPKLIEKLKKHPEFSDILIIPEYEIELLLRHDTLVAPLILRALDLSYGTPAFLAAQNGSDRFDLVLGADLAFKLRLARGHEVRLMSPAHTDLILFGEVPRMHTALVSDIIMTDVPEVDSHHGWVRLSFVQNMIREKSANRLRFFSDRPVPYLENSIKEVLGQENMYYQSWEEQHQTLVWALNLETTVMVFLFVAMNLLVSLCITSGLLIFFDKVRHDLASFWIMGASRRSLDRASAVFLSFLTFVSVLSGLLVGALFLYVLDNFAGEIMPVGFVDRKIPVKITPLGVSIAFLTPVVISMIFSYYSLFQFKKENDFLETVRSV